MITIRKLLAFISVTPTLSNAEVPYFVEADPLAYLSKGYSLHTGLQWGHMRYQAGLFGAEIPRPFLNNKNFSVRQTGYGFKADYQFRDRGGFFAGVSYSLTTIAYRLESTGLTEKRPARLIGTRVGYQYIFNSGVYVSPWMGIMFNTSDTHAVDVAGQTYNVNSVNFFPTIHLGYQF